jgi:hypothetical protein
MDKKEMKRIEIIFPEFKKGEAVKMEMRTKWRINGRDEGK